MKTVTASGFPLEVKVGRVLTGAGASVTYGWNYYDSHAEASKEIDLVGQWWLDAGVPTTVHILISCKTLKTGLVTFESSSLGVSDGDDLYDRYFFGSPRWIHNASFSFAAYRTADVLGWTDEAWPAAETTTNQFAVIRPDSKRNPPWIADHGDLWTNGLQPLLRGLDVYRERHGNVAEGNAFLNFAALVLIVDGPLWAFGTGPRASLRKVEEATYFRHHANSQSPALYRVDFVRAAYLETYLRRLDRQMRELEARISAKAEAIRFSATQPNPQR